MSQVLQRFKQVQPDRSVGFTLSEQQSTASITGMVSLLVTKGLF